MHYYARVNFMKGEFNIQNKHKNAKIESTRRNNWSNQISVGINLVLKQQAPSNRVEEGFTDPSHKKKLLPISEMREFSQSLRLDTSGFLVYEKC